MASSAASNGSGTRLPYTPPRLTIHGTLQAITAAKGGNRSDSGKPKTWSNGSP